MYFLDTNIVVDIINSKSPWHRASTDFIAEMGNEADFIINAIVFAEMSSPFASNEECLHIVRHLTLNYEEIPPEAAFLAGKAFLQYRKAGGRKHTPLPDFFIGAHALVGGYKLITRDKGRYKTYFPRLEIITP